MMNKLTAEKCRERIASLKRNRRVFGLAMDSELYLKALEIALPVLERQENPDDAWIEWNGGDCPVADYEHVELRWSNNVISRGRASNFGWENRIGQGHHSIIAYRVIENDGRED